MANLITEDQIDMEDEEYSEFDYVYDKVVEIDEKIDKYFDFINYLWDEEVQRFNLSDDCNFLLADSRESKDEFYDVLLAIPYYKQLIISKHNFAKRLEKLRELQNESTE